MAAHSPVGPGGRIRGRIGVPLAPVSCRGLNWAGKGPRLRSRGVRRRLHRARGGGLTSVSVTRPRAVSRWDALGVRPDFWQQAAPTGLVRRCLSPFPGKGDGLRRCLSRFPGPRGLAPQVPVPFPGPTGLAPQVPVPLPAQRGWLRRAMGTGTSLRSEPGPLCPPENMAHTALWIIEIRCEAGRGSSKGQAGAYSGLPREAAALDLLHQPPPSLPPCPATFSGCDRGRAATAWKAGYLWAYKGRGPAAYKRG